VGRTIAFPEHTPLGEQCDGDRGLEPVLVDEISQIEDGV
jgi:hypothetical protein